MTNPHLITPPSFLQKQKIDTLEIYLQFQASVIMFSNASSFIYSPQSPIEKHQSKFALRK